MLVEHGIFAGGVELPANAFLFHGDGFCGDKYIGDGHRVFTLRCDSCGEDDCRQRVVTER